MRIAVLALLLSDVTLRSVAVCSDGPLTDVARQIAEKKARGESTPDEAALSAMLRAAGDPHPWPRAWLGSVPARGEQWSAAWKRSGDARCGSGASKNVAVTVGVDALADFDVAVPLRARTGSWIAIEGHMLVSASAARVVVATDSSDPRTIVSTFDASTGKVRARVSAERPGIMTIQVVADLASGPRPVLEARVFVDLEPSNAPSMAPGEWAAGDLAAMLDALRSELGLPAITREAKLDAIATEHTRRMIAAGSATHDAGDGSPIERLTSAGIVAHEAGENVAHAATLALAHRALWNSPSHRQNLVRADFTRAGLAAIAAPDGTVWVTELYAR